MSTVNVQPSRDAADSIGYALYGKGRVSEQHKRNGTTRAAILTCTLASPQEFIVRAELLARAHNRSVELYSYTQNFSPDEFDITEPEDAQRVHDLGVKLAQRMNSADHLVVTHVDSVGAHLHNHVYLINHDLLTGKALKRCTSWTHGLHQVNDELMRDEGCEVLPSPEAPKPEWDIRRDAYKVGGFEQVLGDKVAEALLDARSVDTAAFATVLEEHGVAITETERDGLTYKMRRLDNGKTGRRKASSLCDEFTSAGINQIIEFHRNNAERATDEYLEESTGSTIDLGDIDELDVEARRNRAATEQADEGNKRLVRVRTSDGRRSLEQAHETSDLARARAELHSAARRRDEEKAQRDREDPRGSRSAAKQQRGIEATRRINRATGRFGRAHDDEANREEADGAGFEL